MAPVTHDTIFWACIAGAALVGLYTLLRHGFRGSKIDRDTEMELHKFTKHRLEYGGRITEEEQ